MTGLRRFFRAARYRQVIRNLAGPRLLRAFADTYRHAFFVEIGSNDGEQHDHLRPFILSRPWRGIMVEPVPYVFERLRTNYEAYGRIALENVAVGDADGLDTLLERSQASHVDLLLIDTEGHDWEILRSIDFARWRPRLVIYEHYHLSPTARAAAREQLGLVGYETMEEGFDTFCLDTSVDDALTDLWRSLSPAVEGVAAYEEAA
ncbi:MAG: hypothetical protein AUG75_22840 [Cyanobacteria bacterium 13_1_20CM_4_61_6]|nr:MAG: hypothetical protein AUG75_22840 [Cyanobacteria bacterium 13_1_20CM_4_61_6]